MKITKNILTTAMAALLLTGCAEEVSNDNGLNDGRILFSATIDPTVADLTVTRAQCAADSIGVVPLLSDFGQPLFLHCSVDRFPVSGAEAVTRGTMINNVTTGLAALGRFGVSGSRYLPATQTYNDVHANFFYNAEAVMRDVEWWQTTQPYYLPATNERLAFYAYAPYAASFGTTEVTALTGDDASEQGPMVIDYTVNPDPAQQADLITAYTHGIPFDDGTRVNLNFTHALTAVRFELSNEVAPGWYIKTLTLQNVISHARYKVGTGWLNDNVIARNSFSFDYTGSGRPNGILLTSEDKALTTAAQTLLMIPQTFNANNQLLQAELYNPTTGTTRTLTHTLNGSTWTAGTVVTYTVSTSSVTYLNGSVAYPEDWGGETFELKSAYDNGAAVGVYAVDINTHQVVIANTKLVYNKTADTWATEDDDVIKYKKSYDYYYYYPYKSTLSGGRSEGDTFSGSGASDFFSGVISGWTVSDDQSTAEKLLANDLHIGQAVHDAEHFTHVNVAMQHALGLAKVTLQTVDVTPRYNLSPGNTSAATQNYVVELSDKLIYRASNQGISDYMCPNSDLSAYHHIYKGAVNQTFMSTSTGEDQWKSALTGSIVNGQCYKGLAELKEVPDLVEYDGWYFDYTGGPQTFTVPSAGIYQIECWGASGGRGWLYSSTPSLSTNGGTGMWAAYGRGGYTAGTIVLTGSEELYVYCGKQGANAVASKSGTAAASWNGGGSARTASDVNDGAGAGGGASDVRLVSGNWNDFNSLKSRIMVAGGGGGAATCNGTSQTAGLHAGGLAVSGNLTPWYANSPWTPVCNQTQGYQFGTGYSGRLGHFGEAGGGGGYYGGVGRTTTNDANYWGSCSGGSSFISGHDGCNAVGAGATSANRMHTGQPNHYSGYVFTNTKMIDGAGYEWTTVRGSSVVGVPKTLASGRETTGHTGNGFVRIVKIQ